MMLPHTTTKIAEKPSSKYDLSKPSLALVAPNAHGEFEIKFAVGAIRLEIEQDGGVLEMLGMQEPPALDGVWVWSGTWEEVPDANVPFTLPVNESYRKPTAKELEDYAKGICPWHDGLWYTAANLRVV